MLFKIDLKEKRWCISDRGEKEHEQDLEEKVKGVWRIGVTQALMEL